MLIISLPNISWSDLDRGGVPNLDRLVDGSAIASLSTRTDLATTRLGDAYLTIGAGTRAVGDPATDGDGLMAGERFGDSSAGEVYRQRTGRAPAGIVALGLAPILENNDEQLRNARVGALGEALEHAGYERAVIADADGQQPDSPPAPTTSRYRRQAVLALMDPAGRLDAGRVDGLLADDPGAPFGGRLDVPGVLRAFDGVWKDKSVVLVEASDLAREDVYRPFVTSEERGIQLDHALARSDELVGRLLERVDPARDAVFVVGPTYSSRGVSLTPLAIRAPGFSPGLLRSGTTRRAGFVQLIDVAPTILHVLGIEAPIAMDGRPAEVAKTGGSARERRDFLVTADAAARFRDERLGEVRLAALAMSVLLVGLLAYASGRRRPGRAATQRILGRAALFVLAFLPTTFLARLLPFHDLGIVAYWAFLVVVSAGLAVLYDAAGRRHPLDPLLAALLVPVAILVLDVVLGSRLGFNSVLGFSPTVAGRFSGFSNPTYALLTASALLGAVVLAARIGGRRGAWAGVALLGALVIVDGAPFWGSDVGGILSLVPAFGVTAALLLGWRIRRQAVAWCVIGAVLAGGAFALLDLSRPPARRTHLGQLVERIDQRGSASSGSSSTGSSTRTSRPSPEASGS